MKYFVFAATLLAASAGMAQQPPFLAKAAQGDMAEVDMGYLAQSHGTTANVRAYGKMLVDDHGAHREKIVKIAEARKITVPAAVSAGQKVAHDQMAEIKGADFDAAFKAHMIEDHQKDIAEYKAQLAGGDAQVAALAKETLPVLEKHLAAAEKL